jgi:hypothetical protein
MSIDKIPHLQPALEHLRQNLTAGQYVHVPAVSALSASRYDDIGTNAKDRHDGKRNFNMTDWAVHYNHECETICCLGGWLECDLGRGLTGKEKDELFELVFPETEIAYDDITPAECVVAITAFLAGAQEQFKNVRPPLEYVIKEGQSYSYYRMKADQHWELAGLARKDGDIKDADKNTELARRYDAKAHEAYRNR